MNRRSFLGSLSAPAVTSTGHDEVRCKGCGWRLGPRAIIARATGYCVACWHGLRR